MLNQTTGVVSLPPIEYQIKCRSCGNVLLFKCKGIDKFERIPLQSKHPFSQKIYEVKDTKCNKCGSDDIIMIRPVNFLGLVTCVL